MADNPNAGSFLDKYFQTGIAPEAGASANADTFLDTYFRPGPHETPLEPGLGDKIIGGLSALTSAAGVQKHKLVDPLFRKISAAQGLPTGPDTTSGQIVRARAGLAPEPDDENLPALQRYGKRGLGWATEFGTDILTDPLTWELAGVGGLVAKGARAATAGKLLEGGGELAPEVVQSLQEAQRAGQAYIPYAKPLSYAEKGLGAAFGLEGAANIARQTPEFVQEVSEKGFTPEAFEHGLGILGGGYMAYQGLRHAGSPPQMLHDGLSSLLAKGAITPEDAFAALTANGAPKGYEQREGALVKEQPEMEPGASQVEPEAIKPPQGQPGGGILDQEDFLNREPPPPPEPGMVSRTPQEAPQEPPGGAGAAREPSESIPVPEEGTTPARPLPEPAPKEESWLAARREGNKLQILGWEPKDIDLMAPEQRAQIIDQGLRPEDMPKTPEGAFYEPEKKPVLGESTKRAIGEAGEDPNLVQMRQALERRGWTGYDIDKFLQIARVEAPASEHMDLAKEARATAIREGWKPNEVEPRMRDWLKAQGKHIPEESEGKYSPISGPAEPPKLPVGPRTARALENNRLNLLRAALVRRGWENADVDALDKANIAGAKKGENLPELMAAGRAAAIRGGLEKPQAAAKPAGPIKPGIVPPELTDRLAKKPLGSSPTSDPGLAGVLRQVAQDHGIKLEYHPENGDKIGWAGGLKWINDRRDRMASGAIHDVFILGEATSGPFKGQKLIMRTGNFKLGGMRMRAADVTLNSELLKDPDVIPTAYTGKTNIHTIEVTPWTYKASELPKELKQFANPDKDFSALRKRLVARGFNVMDLHGANARYYIDPVTKRPRLVVSDFGVVAGDILRQEPVARSAPPGTIGSAVSVLDAKLDKQGRNDNIKGAEKLVGIAHLLDHVNSIGGQLAETFKSFFKPESAEKVRASLIKEVQTRLAQDGIVPLTGLYFNTSNPERFMADVAVANRFNRAPFEIFHIVAWDKAGKVVDHRAWTSGRADAVNISHDLMTPHLEELAGRFKKGEIAGWVDIHNHSGGVPNPSGPDVNTSARWMKIYKDKGYLGGIVTNHKEYGFMLREGDELVARKKAFTDPEHLEQIGPVDPLFGDPLTKFPLYRKLGGGLDWGTRAEQMARYDRLAQFGKSTFGNEDSVRAYYLNNDGHLMAIHAFPVSSLFKPEDLSAYMNDVKARTGGAFVYLLHQGYSAESIKNFRMGAAGLLARGTISDGFAVTAPENRIAQLIEEPKTGIPRQLEEPVPSAIQVRAEPVVEEKTPGRDEAEAALKPILEAHKIKPPIEIKEPLEDIQKRAAEFQKEAPSNFEAAKPGGAPDLGLNLAKDLPDASTEQKKEAFGLFKAIQEQLDRAKAQPIDWEKAVADAKGKLLEPGISLDEAVQKLKRSGRPADQKDFALLYLAWKEKARLADDAKAAWEAAGKNPGAKEAWDKAQIEALAYGMYFVNKKTEAARILKSLDAAKHGEIDPHMDFMGQFMRGLKREGIPEKAINQLWEIYNRAPEDFPDALRKALQPKWYEKLLEAWTAGLVSGPPTRIANISSNGVFRGLLDTENVVASMLDPLVAKLAGRQRERFLDENVFALGSLKMALEGPDGAVADWIHAQGGITLQPVHGRFATGFEVRGVGKIGGKLGEAVRIPFKELEVDDSFFKHIAAIDEAHRIAYRQARKELSEAGKSWTREELYKKAGEYAGQLSDVARNGPDSKYYKQYKSEFQQIQYRMKRDTFQLQLGQLGKAIQQAQQAHPLVQILLPFVRTPANIAKEAIYRTPYGFFKAYKLWKEGVRDGRLSEELAKPTLGSLIGLSMGMAAMQGLFTGGGPADPKANQNLKETGWQPYSWKVGDQYISYGRVEPLSSIMGMAADMAEAYKAGDLKTVPKLADKLVASLGNNLTNKTFLAGLEGFFTAWHDPARYAEQWLKQLEASAVPNIARRAAVAIDPTVRETSVGASPILSGIPGLSQMLPAKLTPLGEEQTRPGTAIERFLSPFMRGKNPDEKAKLVAGEFDRIGYVPPSISKSMKPGGYKVDLTTQERQLMAKAQRLAANAVAMVIKDPTYKALPDNEEDPRAFGRKTKKDVIERIFSKYRRLAIDQITPGAAKRAGLDVRQKLQQELQ